MVKKQTLDQKVGSEKGFLRVSFPEEGFGDQSGRIFVVQYLRNLRNNQITYSYLNGKSIPMNSYAYQFIKEHGKQTSYQP